MSWVVLVAFSASVSVLAQNVPSMEMAYPPPSTSGLALEAHVSGDGTVRLDGLPADSSAASDRIRGHILAHPDGAVRFWTARGLPYEIYIQRLDTIKAAFMAERDRVSLREYGFPYARLKPSARDSVATEVPLRIVLAEPGEDG